MVRQRHRHGGAPCKAPRRAARRRSAGVAVALLLGLTLAGPASPAGAWSNGDQGGNGFGTHDWVLYETRRVVRSRGGGWLVLRQALPRTDDPDTRLHDTYHHCYDRWGASHYGDAPSRIAELYRRCVRQLRSGRRAAASRTFGLLSHYYADICNPTHTDQTADEERMHARHEAATNTRTNARGEHRGWVRFDGFKARGDAAAAARAAAGKAHDYYSTLVKHYNASGWDSTVQRITRRRLNRAVNDLADLLVSARRASR